MYENLSPEPTEVPLEILEPLQDQSVKEHETVTLRCVVSKPNIPSTWKHANRKITDGGRYELRVEETVHTCVIKDARDEDQGHYRVDIANKNSECQVSVEGKQHETSFNW